MDPCLSRTNVGEEAGPDEIVHLFYLTFINGEPADMLMLDVVQAPTGNGTPLFA